MLSDATIAAIATLITALAGLVTAIHAHSKSTAANTTADAAHNYVKALYEVATVLIPVLTKQPVKPAVKSESATPVPEDEILSELTEWLARQHTKTTGQPVGGPATTDFSLVLNEIAAITQRVGDK